MSTNVTNVFVLLVAIRLIDVKLKVGSGTRALVYLYALKKP
jgi:hypothetical protein